jgi:hypothetical protein
LLLTYNNKLKADPKNIEAHSFHALAVIKFHFLAAIFHFQFHFSFSVIIFQFFPVICIFLYSIWNSISIFFNWFVWWILFSRRRDRRSGAERQAK